MARVQAKKPGTAVVNWEQQLADEAQAAAKQEESTATGQFFSIRAGQLSWQDTPVAGNRMAVVVVDSIFETVYYEGDYDPDNPVSPTAFAFAREQEDLHWHENSDPEFAGKACADSEVCQWGTAEKGRGKAAKETRRLAMIVVGSFDKRGELTLIEDPQHYASTELGFMKLPVMSVKGWSGYVKTVAGTLKRPPHGVITEVSVVPDPKSQFRVVFEAAGKVPDELMIAVMQRREEAMATIMFPYAPREDEPAKPAAKRGSSKAQPPAAKRGARKY